MITEATKDLPQLRLWSLADVKDLANPLVQCPVCEKIGIFMGFPRVSGMAMVYQCTACNEQLSSRDFFHIMRNDIGRNPLDVPNDFRVMCGKALVERLGQRLINAMIKTWPMGDYPGGSATIIELEPDSGAEEIVFTIEHPTFISASGNHQIGHFGHELAQLIKLNEQQTSS